MMNFLKRYFPLLLPLLVLLPGLGLSPLFDVDEGAFSEATREMLVKGDYLSTWLNGNPRFDKPILIYWLQAISVTLFGQAEWAFRLPSALAAVVWCYVISRFAEEFFDREAGLMACVVTLTCLGVQLIGRAATADALLNMFLALILTDLWRYLATGRIGMARRVFLWIGLGFLTKGPIALLVPGATVFLWCLTSRRWAPLFKALSDLPGWLLMLSVSLPWYIAAYAIHGDAFIQGFFIKHNVQRFSGAMEGHGGSGLYYFLLMPVFFLPWLPWLLSALRNIPRNWGNPLSRFLWLWCGFVVIFFSLSGTKLPHYVLYGCTPLFVLVAAEYRLSLKRWLAPLSALLMLAFYVSVPFWLGLLPVKDAFYAAQLTRLPEVLAASSLLPLWLAVGVAALAWWYGRAVFRPEGALWSRVAMLAVLGCLVLSFWLAPILGEVGQGPTKRAALLAKTLDRPVVQLQVHWPSFSVYLAAETPYRKPQAGEVAVGRIDRLPPPGEYQLMYREAGVVLIENAPGK